MKKNMNIELLLSGPSCPLLPQLGKLHMDACLCNTPPGSSASSGESLSDSSTSLATSATSSFNCAVISSFGT